MSDRDYYEDDEEREEGTESGDVAPAPPAAAPQEPEQPPPAPKECPEAIEVPLQPQAPAVTVLVPAAVAHRQAGSDLPAWLPFLLADDVYWFRQALKGEFPPEEEPEEAEAEVEAAEEDEEEEGEEGEEEEEAAPAHEEPEEGEEDEETAPRRLTKFDPNTKFTLEECARDDDGTLTLKLGRYIAPAAAAEAEEGEEEEHGDHEGEEDDEGREEEHDEEHGHEEAEQRERVTIDAVTLAALLSGDCLRVFFETAGTSFDTAVSWIDRTFSPEDPCPVTEALTSVGTSAGAKRVPMPTGWVFERLADETVPRRERHHARHVFQRLLKAGFAPVAPPSSTLLSTPGAVDMYAWLLLNVPRSLLVAWAKLGDDDADEEEDDEEPEEEEAAPEDEDEAAAKPLVPRFLARIALDLRKRAARAIKGKPAPKTPAAAVASRLFPARGGERGKRDVRLTQQFAPRGYTPAALTLFSTDVAVLLCGQSDDTVDAFSALLNVKLSKKRERADPFGLPTLLWHCVQSSLSPKCTAHLIDVTPASWFARCSVVDSRRWAREALPPFGEDEATPFAGHARPFAEAFCAVVNDDPDLRSLIADAAPAVADQLGEVREAQVALTTVLATTPPEGVDHTAVEEQLEAAVAKAGQAACTPAAMATALDARNAPAVVWLLNRGVSQVQVQGGPVPLLKAIAEREDADLLSLLVMCGASLSAPWEGGRTNGLCYVQDHFPAAQAEAILDRWRARDEERARDPREKMGLLLPCLA